jgi:hypothetical protein
MPSPFIVPDPAPGRPRTKIVGRILIFLLVAATLAALVSRRG